MITFPGMLIAPAKEAGMKVPDHLYDDFNPNQFPHFQVFLILQLGRKMPSPDSHWRNAKIIASIPNDRIMGITGSEIQDLGFE